MSIRRSLAAGLVALPLIAGTVVAQPTFAAHHTVHKAAAHKTYKVKMEPGSGGGFIFSPAKLTIHVGDTVQWVDVDSTLHNIVGQNSFSKKVINRSAFNTKSYKVTFKKKGTYKYECQIHLPRMVGQIIVK